MPGTLFVVATPIGNLEDLSFRALRTLREVDLIAAEDTRRTAKLLAHYEIRRPVVSLREHNEARETPRLVARMAKGESVALVSDAGTPGIADPGARLVRSSREHGIGVVPIPGPNAIAAALSVSGFPADEFVFLGFPPRGGQDRQDWLARVSEETRTTVFFESPHRIGRTLTEVQSLLVDRPMLVGREITKVNEEFVISPINVAGIRPQGEFTVTIGPRKAITPRDIDPKMVVELFGRLTNMASVDETTATKLVASAFSVTSSHVRKILKKAKILVDRQNKQVP